GCWSPARGTPRRGQPDKRGGAPRDQCARQGSRKGCPPPEYCVASQSTPDECAGQAGAGGGGAAEGPRQKQSDSGPPKAGEDRKDPLLGQPRSSSSGPSVQTPLQIALSRETVSGRSSATVEEEGE